MSFDRRPKRIAGPGFHVNVRYDDETVSRMRTSQDADVKVGRVPNDEVYDVKEMELLVAHKKSAMYYDGYTHCFTSVNGYPATANQSAETIKKKILDEVRFIGVAVTEYQPSKAYAEQGFVAQVGGVVTMLNEGRDNIKPGEKVQLSLDLDNKRKVTRDKGIPREKVRFCIERAKDNDAAIKEAMKVVPGASALACDLEKELNEIAKQQGILDSKSLGTSAKKTALTALKAATTALQAKKLDPACENLKKFLAEYRKTNERVIGKALGYARPGDRVEILLQPRHAY